MRLRRHLPFGADGLIAPLIRALISQEGGSGVGFASLPPTEGVKQTWTADLALPRFFPLVREAFYPWSADWRCRHIPASRNLSNFLDKSSQEEGRGEEVAISAAGDKTWRCSKTTRSVTLL